MKISLPLSLLFVQVVASEYEIGIGIADVTGPIAEIGFMGYGKFDQKGTGLHLRQWSRSYIIHDGNQRIVFVSVDIGMIGDNLRMRVISILKKEFGELYNKNNVIISGTHTHSAPGGFLRHTLFDLPILGFSYETYNALVSGIVQSIINAHNNIQTGRIFFGNGNLLNANINRSPSAYLENPAKERSRYRSNVDTEMVQLKFVSIKGQPLGVVNWFPVHPTSMNNTNTLVSSDNVGYASIKFEQRMNPKRTLGKGPFIASFASSNLGDVSPNIKGPKCQPSGKECDIMSSTCGSKAERCIASGPGDDMFESTAIIAERLFQKAWEIWISNNTQEIHGPIASLHQYKNMATAEEIVENGDGHAEKIRGCHPAMGYSFAAGTTDGPGAFSFQQGTITDNPMWNMVRDFLSPPTLQDIECHSPKPILLATGRMKFPYDWQPSIVSTQVAIVGNVLLACVPGEFTTMAGRRMRESLTRLAELNNLSLLKVVIVGLCNTYSDYITTFEEYQVQRYEGASTIYGPHTLDLYIVQYRKLAEAIFNKQPLDPGPQPQLEDHNTVSFITPVIFDTANNGNTFGDVVKQPPRKAYAGDIVTARFVSGHPRNNLRHGDTYCTVERQEGVDAWTVVATDANWETKIRWIRKSKILGSSEMEVEWTIPQTTEPGMYRLRHFGHYKFIFGGITPYEGTTQSFEVINAAHCEVRNTGGTPKPI